MAKVNKIKWGEDDIEKLIDLFEEKPCLWDISHSSYSKREKKVKHTKILVLR